MAQWFGALTALAEDSSVFPTGGSLQSPVAPAPGNLTTSGLRVHRHSCTYTQAIYTCVIQNKNKSCRHKLPQARS